MKLKADIKLTSAEIGALWTTYMNDSMVMCTVKYFLQKVKDTDIKPVLKYALSLLEKHLIRISEIFNTEGHPIPLGFNEKDVNVNVPALYDDHFYLFYLRNIARLNLDANGIALTLMSR